MTVEFVGILFPGTERSSESFPRQQLACLRVRNLLNGHTDRLTIWNTEIFIQLDSVAVRPPEKHESAAFNARSAAHQLSATTAIQPSFALTWRTLGVRSIASRE